MQSVYGIVCTTGICLSYNNLSGLFPKSFAFVSSAFAFIEVFVYSVFNLMSVIDGKSFS